jgi:hypothetical protein
VIEFVADLHGSTIGRTENCINCVVAGDVALEGRRATALPSDGPVKNGLKLLQEHFASQNGGDIFKNRTIYELKKNLLDAGDGSRGIVFVKLRRKQLKRNLAGFSLMTLKST